MDENSPLTTTEFINGHVSLDEIDIKLNDLGLTNIATSSSQERSFLADTVPNSFSNEKTENQCEVTSDVPLSNIVYLNVGGYYYSASLSTLRKYEDSVLAMMFSGRYELARDKNGYVFIDRDGRYFGYILNYIRGNHMPPEFVVLDLLREAEFFCIPSLINRLETSSPSIISLRRRESFRRLIPDYERLKMDIIQRSAEKLSSFHESRVVITQLDHCRLKGVIPCYNCSREFVTVNHACAFDGSTPDLQIEHQLKRIQSDIHINMDKLVSFLVNEFVHDGFKASAARITCRFSIRCQSCTVSGLYTAGGILAPRECRNVAHVIKFIWS